MSAKTNKTATDYMTDVALQGGIVLMTAAATLGLVELPHDPDKRAIVPTNHPAFAVAQDAAHNQGGGPEIRRERDEVHPHSQGYGVNHRTPSRTRDI